MEIRLHNTLARRVEPFVPLDPARVTMYVCGPTVYNYVHIGNARPPVVFGVLATLLRRRFPQVVYARNITDVDDKINTAARERGVPIADITGRFAAAYAEDMRRLGAGEPDVVPHATTHIPQIIAMVERLIASGHAYAAEGHVLFSVASFPDYGRLSGRDPEELLAGARVEVAPYKRDAGDFVLWKPSTPDLPGWDSPWGRAGPAGTSNVRRWRRRIWARRSTSMPAASTCSSRTTRTRSRRARARTAARCSRASGCTTAC